MATIDDGELEHVCGVNIDVKIYDEHNSEIKAISVEDLLQSQQALYINWVIKNGDVILQSNEINNIKLTLPNKTQQKLEKSSQGQYIHTIKRYGSLTLYHQVKENFTITVTLANGQEVSKDFGYIITFPSYIGLIRDDAYWRNAGESWKDYLIRVDNNNNIESGQILNTLLTRDYWCTEPTKLLLENQAYIYNYTNEGYEVSYTDSIGQSQTTNSPYHVCYIYPAEAPNNINSIKNGLSSISGYKPLTSIKDSKDLEYINDFTKVTPEYIGSETGSMQPYIIGRFGNSTVLYNVYIDEIPAFVNNYTLTLK